PENQPHRGDLAKMLVHRRARRRGVGAALLAAAERSALEAGKTLLVLDTASDGAERPDGRRGGERWGRGAGHGPVARGEPRRAPLRDHVLFQVSAVTSIRAPARPVPRTPCRIQPTVTRS